MGPRGFRRGRRRGLIVGAAIGSAAARRNNNDDQAAQAAPADDSADDQMAQLEKLGQLKEQGILTDEEFQAKKKQILGL